MRSRRLQPILVVASGVLALTVFSIPVLAAENPAAAAGIGLQTLAGFLAAVQLWANNASDRVVKSVARQIEVNRWHVAGLFDGRPISLIIATAWYVIADIAIRSFNAWDPNPVLGWTLVIPLLLFFIGGGIAMILTFALWGSAALIGENALPDDRPLTSLHDQAHENEWIWPIVGVAFLLGGMLQLAVA